MPPTRANRREKLRARVLVGARGRRRRPPAALSGSRDEAGRPPAALGGGCKGVELESTPPKGVAAQSPARLDTPTAAKASMSGLCASRPHFCSPLGVGSSAFSTPSGRYAPRGAASQPSPKRSLALPSPQPPQRRACDSRQRARLSPAALATHPPAATQRAHRCAAARAQPLCLPLPRSRPTAPQRSARGSSGRAVCPPHAPRRRRPPRSAPSRCAAAHAQPLSASVTGTHARSRARRGA